MPTCYREHMKPGHRHIGPFNRCSKCGRTICCDCSGKHLESGQVICIECSRSSVARLYYRIIEMPWAENYRLSKRALGDFLGIIFMLFNTLVHSIGKFFYIITEPLRRDSHGMGRAGSLHFGVDVADYRDKVRFALVFIVVLIATAIIGLLYSAIKGIPHTRILFAMAATCTFWGVAAIYLQHLFEPGLQRPVSQMLAYATAFFIALLFGSWLMSLEIIDRMLGFLAR